GEVVGEKVKLAIKKTTRPEKTDSVIYGNAALFEKNPQLHSIPVPGGDWQLAIAPKYESILAPHTCFVNWAVAISICFSIAMVVYFYRRRLLERQTHLQHLESILSIDPLTQLTSRYKFNEQLTALIENCGETDERFTLLLIDLD